MNLLHRTLHSATLVDFLFWSSRVLLLEKQLASHQGVHCSVAPGSFFNQTNLECLITQCEKLIDSTPTKYKVKQDLELR